MVVADEELTRLTEGNVVCNVSQGPQEFLRTFTTMPFDGILNNKLYPSSRRATHLEVFR